MTLSYPFSIHLVVALLSVGGSGISRSLPCGSRTISRLIRKVQMKIHGILPCFGMVANLLTIVSEKRLTAASLELRSGVEGSWRCWRPEGTSALATSSALLLIPAMPSTVSMRGMESFDCISAASTSLDSFVYSLASSSSSASGQNGANVSQ